MNAEKKIEKKYVETPLMKQYYSIKAVHPDAILLFRVGDFYETFGDDAIKASGIQLVIADSFARIFYRNSIDIGLPIIECPAAAKAIRDGDEVAVNLDTGVIEDKTTGESFTAAPFPPFIQKIIAVGGIENFVREKIAGKA